MPATKRCKQMLRCTIAYGRPMQRPVHCVQGTFHTEPKADLNEAPKPPELRRPRSPSLCLGPTVSTTGARRIGRLTGIYF
jgi:hypothetical protein